MYVHLLCAETAGSEHRIGWSTIYNTMRPTISKITNMKFESPLKPEEEYKLFYKALEDEIVSTLRNLAEK